MELTFFDFTLLENSLFRNKQVSTPAAIRKTVPITTGTRVRITLLCWFCGMVVTVDLTSAVLV